MRCPYRYVHSWVLLLCLLLLSRCDSHKFGLGKIVSSSSKLVTGTVKGSGKAAYYLLSPKHVELSELEGQWRLDRDDGMILHVELPTPNGNQLLVVEGTHKTVYKFRPSKFQRRASIEFEYRGLIYKASVHRKLAAQQILKLKGKIYQKGRWGKSRHSIGTFVGRKRVSVELDEEEEEEEEGQYDVDEEDQYDVNEDLYDNDEEYDFDGQDYDEVEDYSEDGHGEQEL